MKNLKNAASYAAPECEILESQSEGVLCLSPSTEIPDWERDPEIL